MSWLIDAVGRALDLKNDIALLEIAAALQAHLEGSDALVNNPAEVDAMLRALRGMLDGVEPLRSDLVLALAAGGLSEPVIDTALRRAAAVLGAAALPAAYGLLGCRLSAVNGPGCAQLPRQLVWRIIDREASGTSPVLNDLKLTIGGRAHGQLTLTVDAELPAGFPFPGSSKVLRLGFSGKVTGSVAGEVPIQLGAIAMGVAGQAALELDYFFARGGNGRVGSLLAAVLAQLPSPYDLGSLAPELDTRRLLGLRLRAQGTVTVAGHLQVGPGLELVRGFGASASLGVGMRLTESGIFELTVRACDTSRGLGSAVRVDLHRAVDSAEASGVGLGVSLDLDALYRQIQPQLRNRFSDSQVLLETVGEWLPTARAVGDRLRQAAAEWVRHPPLERVIAVALGRQDPIDAQPLLVSLLLRQVDALEGIWTGAAQDQAETLLRAALAEAGSDSVTRDTLMDALVPALVLVIEGLRTDLRAGLAARIGSSGHRFDALRTQCNAILGPLTGLDAREASLRLDTLAAAVAQVLDGTQRTLATLAGSLARAQSLRIAAMLRSERQRSGGRRLALGLEIDPSHSAAATLFQQCLTGSLDGAIAAAGAGGPVLAVDGQLIEYAGVESRAGLDVAFLDLRLSKEHWFRGDIETVTDHAGHQHVFAAGESGRVTRLFGSERTLSAVNVLDLAIAFGTRRMRFALAVSHRSDDLDANTVRAFLGSLATAGIDLLPAGIADRGVRYLADLAGSDADGVVQGELVVRMELSDTELRRLLDVGDDPNAVQVPLDALRIRRVAIDTLIGTMGRFPTPNRTLREMRTLMRQATNVNDLADLIEQFARGRSPIPWDTTRPDELNVVKRMQGLADRANELVSMIRAMRDAYAAGPSISSGQWQERDLQIRQERIDAALQRWFQAELEDSIDPGALVRSFRCRILGRGCPQEDGDGASRSITWLNPRVLPYTLALLKSLRILTRDSAASPDGSPLLVDLVLDPETGVRQIALV